MSGNYTYMPTLQAPSNLLVYFTGHQILPNYPSKIHF